MKSKFDSAEFRRLLDEADDPPPAPAAPVRKAGATVETTRIVRPRGRPSPCTSER